MAKTKIEWTDYNWNVSNGCTRESPGCMNCYAEGVANRFSKPGAFYEGLIASNGRWNGKITLDHRKLLEPLAWSKPRKVFVNSTSDLFHEGVPDDYITAVFAAMALCPHVTFQVLTKRAERMQQFLADPQAPARIYHCALVLATSKQQIARMDNQRRLSSAQHGCIAWPLLNVWVGVSVENQEYADKRVLELLATPAAIRFVSAEPLLGRVDLTRITHKDRCFNALNGTSKYLEPLSGTYQHCGTLYADIDKARPWAIDWVIVGGESGSGARPMKPEWARSLRDQCTNAGVPFFFKQWGEFAPWDFDSWNMGDYTSRDLDGETVYRVGKKLAGNKLDCEVWQQFPEVA